MATELIPYSPVGGINSEIASDSIKNEEVQDASNFIFSRGRAVTRGGVVEKTFSGTGTPVYAQYIVSPQTGGLYFFTMDAAGAARIYRYGAPTTYTQITGAALASIPPSPGIVINANICFPTSAGMVRITTGATYTIIAQVYSYIAGHGARCLGARTGSLPNRVAWSVVGDETDWAGVGSGTTDLSDSSSFISGLGIINDTVIVCRPDGFHFGYPTGSGSMPYRFENKSKDGIGVLFCPVFYDDSLFFGNTQDFFVLSKEGLRPIGGGMQSELTREVNNGRTGNNAVLYRGIVSERLSGEIGPWYHVAPDFPRLKTSSLLRWREYMRRAPHFAYNIREDRWQKFYYPGIFGGVFSAFDEVEGVGAVGMGGEDLTKWYIVQKSQSLEEEAFFQGKTLLIGSADKDMTIRRLLLRYRDQGQYAVKAEVSCDLNGERWGQEKTESIGGRNDGKWKRRWFNLEATGNDFEYRIIVPPGNHLETNLIGGKYEPAPEYQGS